MNPEQTSKCPWCGLRYDAFRTGLTFGEVRQLMWSPSRDPNDWVYRRRNGVLGKWREIKLEMWDEHLHWCEMEVQERAVEGPGAPSEGS